MAPGMEGSQPDPGSQLEQWPKLNCRLPNRHGKYVRKLAKAGADVLLVESGGVDDGPTITNPSVWFTNIGGPMDWSLPIQPSPRLANRQFRLALGHVLGGGSTINAMVWSRGMQRDFDGWAANGARGWSFEDVLPIFKAQEGWEGGANAFRGVGGPIHIRTPKNPHPTAPAFIEAARQMGIPIHADLNGPMQEGAGYINMNIAPDGTRVSAARAFLRPTLSRPNLTLLTNTPGTDNMAVVDPELRVRGIQNLRVADSSVMPSVPAAAAGAAAHMIGGKATALLQA
jgi:choline dehydrogenase-like flavoprotein